MVAVDTALSLSGYALGTLGAALVFVEFFQLPSYVDYQPEIGNYNLQFNPMEAREFTWLGRVGALLIAVAFALQFVAAFV